jgi:hypothetical protein
MKITASLPSLITSEAISSWQQHEQTSQLSRWLTFSLINGIARTVYI